MHAEIGSSGLIHLAYEEERNSHLQLIQLQSTILQSSKDREMHMRLKT